MKKGILIAVSLSLVVGLWLGIDNTDVSALSCAEPREVTEELKISDAVFRGTLTSSNPEADMSKTHYEFQVSEWWKGEHTSSTVKLYSNGWESFEPGKEYIVFVDKSEKRLTPRLCGNTGLSSSVDVTALGDGILPEKLVQSSGNSRPDGLLQVFMEWIRDLLGKI
ncbi:hypothetical protein ACXFAU_02585 [Paenibacillus glucanolyticus]